MYLATDWMQFPTYFINEQKLQKSVIIVVRNTKDSLSSGFMCDMYYQRNTLILTSVAPFTNMDQL